MALMSSALRVSRCRCGQPRVVAGSVGAGVNRRLGLDRRCSRPHAEGAKHDRSVHSSVQELGGRVRGHRATPAGTEIGSRCSDHQPGTRRVTAVSGRARRDDTSILIGMEAPGTERTSNTKIWHDLTDITSSKQERFRTTSSADHPPPILAPTMQRLRSHRRDRLRGVVASSEATLPGLWWTAESGRAGLGLAYQSEGHVYRFRMPLQRCRMAG